MDDGSIIPAIIILALLFGAAYFAVAETAFASVSRIKLKAAADRGEKRAKKAMFVLDNFDKAITTILIGTNITHLAAASYVTVIVTRKWGLSAVSISTVVTTIVVFFVGEMLPKSIAKKYSERFSLGTAGSLCFFMRIFSPISFILTGIGSAVAKLTPGDNEVTVTEEELYDIIETMTDEGELDDEQAELMQSALAFGEVTAETVLTARVDMTAIDVNSPSETLMPLIKEMRHSRIPVYEGTVDNIIGILQIRKYIIAYLNEGPEVDLRSLLDEPHFIHSSTNIDELLSVMSSKKINMAVVTDNYGGTLGIVTVEDILEELVGEIWDEDDVVIETCVKNDDGTYTFDASVDVEEAFDFMDYEDPNAYDFEHKLLSKWAYEQFDYIPAEGESFNYNDLVVTIARIEARRILSLNIAQIPAETDEGGEEE